MSVTIYHNPACGTSRNVLAILLASGANPNVVEYLKTGWNAEQLRELFSAAEISPRDALRTSKSPAEELGLLAPSTTDEALIAAMVMHPVLVNRPIVCTPKGTALCRPSEKVLALLDIAPGTRFVKEDGDEIIAP